MCISWTIKCLVLLMHGATMKFPMRIIITDAVYFILCYTEGPKFSNSMVSPNIFIYFLILFLRPIEFTVPLSHPFILPVPSRFSYSLNPYPTAFPYGNGMVLHFY